MGGTGNTSKPSTSYRRSLSTAHERGTAFGNTSKLSTATVGRCPPSPLKTGKTKLGKNGLGFALVRIAAFV